MQEYQLLKYPQLSNSVVQHGKKKQKKISEKEYQIEKRKSVTEKEHIKQLLDAIYKQSTSKEDFYKRIQDNGLKVYQRNGKRYGIVEKRKYRFISLGFDEKKLETLIISNEFEVIRNQGSYQERSR